MEHISIFKSNGSSPSEVTSQWCPIPVNFDSQVVWLESTPLLPRDLVYYVLVSALCVLFWGNSSFKWVVSKFKQVSCMTEYSQAMYTSMVRYLWTQTNISHSTMHMIDTLREAHKAGANNPECDVQCRGRTEVMWCVYPAGCLGSRAERTQAPGWWRSPGRAPL